MNSTRIQTPTTVETALAYAAKGYRVLRVYGIHGGQCGCRKGPKCQTPGKHPVGKDWTSKATTDETTIRKWFEKRPDYNVGIATGEASGIIVLDMDPRNGGNDSWRQLMEKGPKRRPTPQQVSGGDGRHYVFRHPGGYVTSGNGVLPGIDVKADGGMFVVEPSRHASGGRYRWVDGRSLLTVKPTFFPPEWDFLLEAGHQKHHLLPMRTQETQETHETNGIYSGSPPAAAELALEEDHLGRKNQVVTQSTQRTHEYPGEPKRTQRTQGIYSGSPPAAAELAIGGDDSGRAASEAENRQIIERTLPDGKGRRHEALFALTRELVGLFGPDGLTERSDEIRGIIETWYATALERELTTGIHEPSDCLVRVMESWDKVKIPGGESVLDCVKREVTDMPAHPACKRVPLSNQLTTTLVNICYRLSTRHDDGLFFLSAGDAAKALSDMLGSEVHKQQSYRALGLLVKFGVLRVVRPGEARRGGKATVYQFLGGESDE